MQTQTKEIIGNKKHDTQKNVQEKKWLKFLQLTMGFAVQFLKFVISHWS